MHRKPAAAPQQQQDFVGFMAGLRVSLPTVTMIAQEILSLYTLWERYSDAAPESALGQSAVGDRVGAGSSVDTLFVNQFVCLKALITLARYTLSYSTKKGTNRHFVYH
jgi:hypothetical protein